MPKNKVIQAALGPKTLRMARANKRSLGLWCVHDAPPASAAAIRIFIGQQFLVPLPRRERKEGIGQSSIEIWQQNLSV